MAGGLRLFGFILCPTRHSRLFWRRLVAIISPDPKTPGKGKQCIKIEKRNSFPALDVLDPPAPIAVEGNATLRVTMDDNGEPGSSDTIGIPFGTRVVACGSQASGTT